MSFRSAALVVAVVAALTGAVSLSACAEIPQHVSRPVTTTEQASFEASGGPGTGSDAQSIKDIQVLVTSESHYRALWIIGMEGPDGSFAGEIMYAPCVDGMLLGQCHGTAVHQLNAPPVYFELTISPSGQLTLGSKYRFGLVVSDEDILSCRPVAAFQFNPHSARQIHLVFEAFTKTGPSGGELPIDFGSEAVGEYPAQGMVRWHCDMF